MFNFKNWRKLKRSRQIIAVLIKYGLEFFLDRTKIEWLAKIGLRSRNYQSLTLPERFRLAWAELYPTQVPSFDSFQAQKFIEQELNIPFDKLFKEFEMKPIATTSLSQVHKATLISGEIVAVKIQRPNIKETIELDIETLEDLAEILENMFHNGWVYRPKLMVEEFKKAIRKQLDFTNEAYNFEKFRINFRERDFIKVPKIYWPMTTTKILTMEFIEGTKINEITQEKYKGIFKPEEVANRVAEAILKQILEDGFFHADLIPANLLVLPPATIVMLDVGTVDYLDEKTIFNGAKLLQAIVDKNLDQAVRSLEKLGIMSKEFTRSSLRQDLNVLFDRYLGIPLKNLEISKISQDQDMLEIMMRHNLVLPANLVLMIKALSEAETTVRQLYPDFDMLSLAKPLVKKLLRKRVRRRKMSSNFFR